MRLPAFLVAFALAVSSAAVAAQQAQTHVRLHAPPGAPLAQIPVTPDLEPTDSTIEMAPINQACDAIPYSANHKRWPVKTSVMPALAQQDTLTKALQKRYTVAQVLATKNLAFDTPVPPDHLDRSDAVQIGNEVHHEGDAIAIQGVVLALGCEADGDIHIDLAQSSNAKTCVVVEVANPADLDRGIPPSAAAFVARMERPLRRRFTEIYNQGSPHETPRNPVFSMTVVGQLYYDTDHLQRNNAGGGRGLRFNGVGCARNLWEVHPILDIAEP